MEYNLSAADRAGSMQALATALWSPRSGLPISNKQAERASMSRPRCAVYSEFGARCALDTRQ